MFGRQPTSANSATRGVTCYRCGGDVQVPVRAMSASCPHCHQRLVIESLRISAPYPGREVMTCGDVIVEPGVKLHVQRVVASNVLVRGRVIADVTVRELLEVARTGCIEGDVEAGYLIVRDGGLIRGACRMRPRPKPAAPPSLPPPPTKLPRPQFDDSPVDGPTDTPL